MGQNSSSWVDDDDAWGTFQSTGPTTVSSSSDDPFGDDFATFPSSSSPSNNNSEALAALEWNDASFSQEFKDVDSDDDVPASSSSQNPSSSTAFSSSSARIAIPSWNEDDEGDDDPSTPTGKTSASWGAFGSSSKLDFSSTSPSTSPITSHLSSSPSTQNLSMHATNLSLSTSPSSPFQFGGGAASIFTNMSAISPPDPSLLQAANADEPLGPGVGKDVEACETEEGTMVLEKMGEDGNLISVPMDEIALAVESDIQKKEAEREAAKRMEHDSRSG
ncbi:hypothetical protein BDY24DRAFT_49781 [Mrakia frigida]|uniref:uncharacterized protein n=1 Tax=Mrakia frigida TaxID=29902 RepID=UPI003FCC1219